MDGHTLYLDTPAQVYVLEKFPYSPLSLHAWSLYAIVDQETGEEFNVERFRIDSYQLFFKVEQDARFHFTDLDREEFSGVLQVEGEEIRGMAYDQASQDCLRSKPAQQASLPDNTQRYERTTELYPTTYAQEFHWEAVSAFTVGEETLEIGDGEQNTTILELDADTQRYWFIPR